MTDYRTGTVTAVDASTGLVDCTVDGTTSTVTALALGWLPAVGWTVWLEQRGTDGQDWVIPSMQSPAYPTPGQLVANTSGVFTVTSTNVTEVIASPSTAGLGIANVWLSSLRPYRVEISGRLTQVVNGVASVRVRVSTGTPTTSDTIVCSGSAYLAGSGGPFAGEWTFSRPWTPASTGLWNLACSAGSSNGGSNGSWGNGIQPPSISIYAA